MSYSIPTLAAAEGKVRDLERMYPNGPPGMKAARKVFKRWAVERYDASLEAYGVVVRWAWDDMPEQEMGGAFIWWNGANPGRFNFD